MVLTPLPDSRTEDDGSAVVRVLSYNIRSMRDDPAALARVIRACAPDLVFVQEAPRFFRWRKAAARLAAATDLVVLSGGATAAGPCCSAPCAPPSNAPRTSCCRAPPGCTAGASPRRWSRSPGPGWAWSAAI